MNALRQGQVRLIRWVLFAGFSGVLAGIALAANPTDQLQQLFDTAWKPSPESYETAKQKFEQLKTAAPNDSRVPLSMALVAVKNFKHDDAQKFLEATIPTSPSTTIDPVVLTALRLKIWLQELKKDHTAAEASIRELAHMLSTDDSVAPRAESKDAALWLGGVLGYYASPAAAQLPAPNTDALQSEVTNLLKGSLGNALSDGKTAALKQYEQLQSDQVAQRAEIKAKNATKRADEIKRNQTAQTAAADKLKKLGDASTKDSPDAKESKTASAATQKNVQRLQDQGQRLERQLDDELRKARRDDRTVTRLRQELGNVQQQLANAGSAGGQSEATKQGVEAEKKRLQNLQSTLEAKGKQLASESDDAVATPLDAKIGSLTTYAPIDLEEEKQRILNSYSARQ